MGNKTSEIEKAGRHDGPLDHHLSLIKPSVCFGVKNQYIPTALIAVLDSLYHIPCLCECILLADIDPSCQRADREATEQLQRLFDARAKADPRSVISIDQFVIALTASQLEGDTNDFDQDDPGQVYDAISSLIITTLPDLRGVFLRDKHLKELAPFSKEAAGICITLPPNTRSNIKTIVQEKFFAKAKNIQPSPVFVITTAHASPDLSNSSVIFPTILNMKMGDGSADQSPVYSLQSVIVESLAAPHVVKSFYLIGNELTWYECGYPMTETTMDHVQSLGNADSPYRVRVLIYIQVYTKSKISKKYLSQLAAAESSKGALLCDPMSKFDHIHELLTDPSFNDGSFCFDDRMHEDIDSFDEYDGDDGDDDYPYDDVDYEDDDEDDDDDEGASSFCQCPTCCRSRETKLASEKSKREKEAMEKEKEEKRRNQLIKSHPGTRSVPFQKTPLPKPEKIFIDGRYVTRMMYLQSINAMEGYNKKSPEELRFEDYCSNSAALKEIKQKLDSEIVDRIREATNRLAMEREEKNMRQWTKAADRAWKKYQYAVSQYERADIEKFQVAELFTQTLKLCLTGAHSVGCYYYRALCNFPDNLKQCEKDCEEALRLQPKYSEANLLLGETLARIGEDYEMAYLYMEKAHYLKPTIFTKEKLDLLEEIRVKAFKQIQMTDAENKKTAGNSALQNKDYLEAIRLYTCAIEIMPEGEKSHIYFCNRATARSELIRDQISANTVVVDSAVTDLTASLLDCEESLRLSPSYPKALFRRFFCQALIAFLKDSFEESLQYYNSALELDPTNTLVKGEIRRVNSAIDVIKARERAAEVEREQMLREAQKREERERERQAALEKKAKEEQLKKEREAQKELERLERSKAKAEKEREKAEKEKQLAEEKLREKERIKAEKEREKALKEQEKMEERERKKAEKEREKERQRLEKEIMEKNQLAILEKRRQQLEAAKANALAEAEAASYTPTPSVTVTTPVKKEEPKVVKAATPEEVESPTAKEPKETKEPIKESKEPVATPVVESPSAVKSPATPEAKSEVPAEPATVTPTPKVKAGGINSLAAIAKSIATPATTIAKPAATAAKAPEKPVLSAAAIAAANAIVTRQIDCPQTKVGLVIGAKGSIINEMMKRTGCKMCINQDFPEGQPRKVVFTGTQKQIDDSKALVAAVIIHGPSALNSPELIEEAAVMVKANTFNPMDAKYLNSNMDYSDKSRGFTCRLCVPNSGFSAADKLVALSACNHSDLCSICALRIRLINTDMTCPTCQAPQDYMVCWPNPVDFKIFDVPQNPVSDIVYHPESSIYFPRNYMDIVDHIWENTCRECSQTCEDLGALCRHYSTAHSLLTCNLCRKSGKYFPQEQPLFSSQIDLDSHCSDTTKSGDNSEFHPLCTVCKDRHFDKQALVAHVTSEHLVCNVCAKNPNTVPKYFKDSKALSDHLSNDHFACKDPECKGKVAFKSLFELKAHMSSHKAVENPSPPPAPTIAPTTGGYMVGSGSGSYYESRPMASQSPLLNPMANPLPPPVYSSSLNANASVFYGDSSRLQGSGLRNSNSSNSLSGQNSNLLVPNATQSQPPATSSSPLLFQQPYFEDNTFKPSKPISSSEGSNLLGLFSTSSDNANSNSSNFLSSNTLFGTSLFKADSDDNFFRDPTLQPVSSGNENSALFPSNTFPSTFDSLGVFSNNSAASGSSLLIPSTLSSGTVNWSAEHNGSSNNNSPLTFGLDASVGTASSGLNNMFELDLSPFRSIGDTLGTSSGIAQSSGIGLGDPFGSNSEKASSSMLSTFGVFDSSLGATDSGIPSFSGLSSFDNILGQPSSTSVYGKLDVDPSVPIFSSWNSTDTSLVGGNSSAFATSSGALDLGLGFMLNSKELPHDFSGSGLDLSKSRDSSFLQVDSGNGSSPPSLSPSTSSLFLSSDDRSQLPKDLMDKLIEVLKRYPKEGILGSQIPEAYFKIHGEKLVLETTRGKRLKLLNVLDGHPNVRKEKSGTWRWFYQESGVSQAPSPFLGPRDGTTIGDALPSDFCPALAWLEEYGVNLFRVNCNAFPQSSLLLSDDFQIGLRLRPDMATILESVDANNSGSILDDIKNKSGCSLSIKSILLVSKVDSFLVFETDFSSPSAVVAVDLISDALRQFLSEHNDLVHLDDSALMLEDNPFETSPSNAPTSTTERVHRQLDIPQHAVGLIAGKGGKKLFAMRKKSGAYMSLVSKSKSRSPGKLTISGSAEAVETAMSLVRNALAETDVSF